MSRGSAATPPCGPARRVAGALSLVALTASAQTTGPYTPPVFAAGAQQAGSPAANVAGAAGGQPSFWSASVLVRETATDNVNLTPSNTKEFAMVTEITPTFTFNHNGSRTNLYGSVILPMVIYMPRDVASDRVYPLVSMLGDVAVVKNLFYVEAEVNVQEQFFSPFGAQPTSFVNPTANRFRTDFYRVTPYIRGTTQANTYYELRNDNAWTNLSGAPINTNNSYSSTWSGIVSNVQSRFGLQATFNYTDIDFQNQSPITTQIYRVRPVYNVTPSLRLTASAGYEDNQFTLTSSSGAIYGVGFNWKPTPRTDVSGDFEHRFFGTSYRFAFDHTTPLSVWHLLLSRNITSYPQQVATLPVGANVSAFLNNLFVARVPDPGERQALINEYIQNQGLPSILSSPVNLYTEQILLQQSATGTVGLIGARNTVFFTAFYLKSEPITASGTPLPPLFAAGNDNTQTGGTLVWTHKLTPSLSFIAAIDGLRTVANPPVQATTRQGMVRFGLTKPLTPTTSLFAGARYQTLHSDVQSDYTEAAAFIGINHRFH